MKKEFEKRNNILLEAKKNLEEKLENLSFQEAFPVALEILSNYHKAWEQNNIALDWRFDGLPYQIALSKMISESKLEEKYAKMMSNLVDLKVNLLLNSRDVMEHENPGDPSYDKYVLGKKRLQDKVMRDVFKEVYQSADACEKRYHPQKVLLPWLKQAIEKGEKVEDVMAEINGWQEGIEAEMKAVIKEKGFDKNKLNQIRKEIGFYELVNKIEPKEEPPKDESQKFLKEYCVTHGLKESNLDFSILMCIAEERIKRQPKPQGKIRSDPNYLKFAHNWNTALGFFMGCASCALDEPPRLYEVTADRLGLLATIIKRGGLKSGLDYLQNAQP